MAVNHLPGAICSIPCLLCLMYQVSALTTGIPLLNLTVHEFNKDTDGVKHSLVQHLTEKEKEKGLYFASLLISKYSSTTTLNRAVLKHMLRDIGFLQPKVSPSSDRRKGKQRKRNKDAAKKQQSEDILSSGSSRNVPLKREKTSKKFLKPVRDRPHGTDDSGDERSGQPCMTMGEMLRIHNMRDKTRIDSQDLMYLLPSIVYQILRDCARLRPQTNNKHKSSVHGKSQISLDHDLDPPSREHDDHEHDPHSPNHEHHHDHDRGNDGFDHEHVLHDHKPADHNHDHDKSDHDNEEKPNQPKADHDKKSDHDHEQDLHEHKSFHNQQDHDDNRAADHNHEYHFHEYKSDHHNHDHEHDSEHDHGHEIHEQISKHLNHESNHDHKHEDYANDIDHDKTSHTAHTKGDHHHDDDQDTEHDHEDHNHDPDATCHDPHHDHHGHDSNHGDDKDRLTSMHHNFTQIPLRVWGFSLLAVIIISLVGLASVAIIPVMTKVFYHALIHFLVAMAVGALVGDALLHLLPHAISGDIHDDHGFHGESNSNHGDHHGSHLDAVWKGMCGLAGIVCFFIMERILTIVSERKVRRKAQAKTYIVPTPRPSVSDVKHAVGVKLCAHDDPDYQDCEDMMFNTHTCKTQDLKTTYCTESLLPASPDHQDKSEEPSHHLHFAGEHAHGGHGHSHFSDGLPKSVAAIAWMVIVGDGVHNLCDGLALGAAFSNSITGGISTSIAIFCHELPHEIGDFAVLLQAGMTVKQALIYNCVSSVLCLVGMVIGVAIGNIAEASLWIFAAVAGMFIYIALVDMFPEMMKRHPGEGENGFCRLVLHLLGMAVGVTVMGIIAVYEDKLMNIVDF